MSFHPHSHSSDYEFDEHSREKRGRNLAFSVVHSITCILTDFIDPYVGHIFQTHITCSHGHHGHGHGHHGHGHHGHEHHEHEHGEACNHEKPKLWHSVVGEFAGDLIAPLAVFATEAVVPKQMEQFSAASGKLLEPVFRTFGKIALKPYEHAEDYDEQLENWVSQRRQYLAHFLVYSAFNIGGNVATQKMLGSQVAARDILAAKLLGTCITGALVLAGRAALPDVARASDDFFTEKVFKPVFRTTDRLLGYDKGEHSHEKPAVSHVTRLAETRDHTISTEGGRVI
jgi:hypothetical protein